MQVSILTYIAYITESPKGNLRYHNTPLKKTLLARPF
jgi:hypothetical protein